MKKKSSPDNRKKGPTEEMTHDKFAYVVWSNPFVAKLFMERYLAPEILREIDVDSLELIPTRHTSKKGRDSIGDIYYKFRFKSGKRGVFVVVVEHKARYARFVSIQILRYEADVLDYMSQNLKLFADENGLLPTPCSILLCPTHCPQLDEITSRFESVEYGPRTRFQAIVFNEIDLDLASDEPLLQIAMGLCRFAGYSDVKRGKRQDEIVKLFKALLYYDPSKREKRREIWELVLEASCRYLSVLMRKHDFEIGRFVQGLLDSEKDSEMGYALSPDFFATIFPQKAQELQLCQRQVFIANTRADEERTRADALERILCEKTRESVYEALELRRWFEETPQEVTSALDNITSYARLDEVLSAAKKAGNYGAFLKTLKKVATVRGNLKKF